MRKANGALVALVLLEFTDVSSARADAARSRVQPVVRGGTVVGFGERAGADASAIGGMVALGARLGPASLEAEVSAVALDGDPTPDRGARGSSRRTGLTLRFDLVRVTGRLAGPGAALIVSLEAGVGRERGVWPGGAAFARTDQLAGASMLLEHRPSTRGMMPRYWAWHLGCRATGAPRPDEIPMALLGPCKKQCPPPPERDGHDLGFLVSTGVTLGW
jgi:hypothetical protein